MQINDVTRELHLAGVPHETITEFIDHVQACPEVWKGFDKFALEAATKGRKIGAKAVIERLRWEAEIERGDDFKVNNNWAPYYARVFEIKHPRFKGFFEMRCLQKETSCGQI